MDRFDELGFFHTIHDVFVDHPMCQVIHLKKILWHHIYTIRMTNEELVNIDIVGLLIWSPYYYPFSFSSSQNPNPKICQNQNWEPPTLWIWLMDMTEYIHCSIFFLLPVKQLMIMKCVCKPISSFIGCKFFFD